MSFRVVSLVLDNGPVDRTETLLLTTLAEYGDDRGYCFPGIRSIAHRTRCSERHAIRILKKLAADGWLTLMPKTEGLGRKLTAYQLNLIKLNTASDDTQMSPENNESCDVVMSHDLQDSYDTVVSHDIPESGDIPTHSHVTFRAESHDILSIPILKNHRTIKQPSGAVALGGLFPEDQASATVPPRPAAVLPKRPTRHADFKGAIERHMAGTGNAVLWGAPEGAALARLLSEAPGLTLEAFITCLESRAQSEAVAHGDRPSRWLPNVMKYSSGPLDRFGKLLVPKGTVSPRRDSGPDDFDRRRAESIAEAQNEARRSA